VSNQIYTLAALTLTKEPQSREAFISSKQEHIHVIYKTERKFEAAKGTMTKARSGEMQKIKKIIYSEN
jgi:hypothetical protein